MWSSVKILCLCGSIAIWIQPGETTRPRIVNGYPIKIQKRPFMVSLHHGITGFLCGGSILNQYWVLTAYHCMTEGKDPKDYYVRAGSTYLHEGGSVHWVRNAVYFENTEVIPYDNIPKNDLLLLRLKHKLKFSERIRPINLPRANKKPPRKLWVSGWGKTDSKEISTTLRIVEVHYISYEECLQAADWYPKAVSNITHLCYFRMSYDACQGDSGGPLATNTTIYGIVSFGDGCGTSPGVYTKVIHYRNWIKKVIKPRRRIPKWNFNPMK
ncbi:trypsin epsilon [Diachasma alloeum]|uniref:trypsin epsilon n=1 Tax=Diachasma alloeum TaxID=454923 RepID=UPI0007381CD9|nr:trypsin epsilon [Diachasma alloeum]